MVIGKDAVIQLMRSPLPGKTEQRKLMYRPGYLEINRAYNLLNETIFGNKLKKPKITLERCHGAWGETHGGFDLNGNPVCTRIRMNDRYYSIHWFITVLAHEMAHQWQWEIQGPKRMRRGLEPRLSHGSSFFVHKKKLARMGIPLKTTYRSGKWFQYQDILRC